MQPGTEVRSSIHQGFFFLSIENKSNLNNFIILLLVKQRRQKGVLFNSIKQRLIRIQPFTYHTSLWLHLNYLLGTMRVFGLVRNNSITQFKNDLRGTNYGYEPNKFNRRKINASYSQDYY